MNTLLQKTKHLDVFQVASKMLLVFLLLFSSRISHHYLVVMTALVIFYGVFDAKFYEKPLFWAMIAVFYITGVYINFYNTGNHTFVTLYITLLLLIASSFKRDDHTILYKNARLLLGIIMIFAVVQKFLSTAFMSGASLFYINARGGFFGHLQRFFPENKQIVQANEAKVQAQMGSYEEMVQPIELEAPTGIFGFDPELFAYIIIAVEAVFFMLLFVKNQWIRNGFFICFMLGLIATREETGFASLLCILLFLQAQKDAPIFKIAYLGIFGICTSFIISRLGFF